MGLELLKVSEIRLDGGTQNRVEMSQEVIDDYAEALAAGEKFPPLEVVRDEQGRHWLVDGFHRVLAGEKAGILLLHAYVQHGTQRDAVLQSVGANDKHGLRRNTADKRAAIKKLLLDEEWRTWSDHEIARMCKVDHKTVGSLRASLVATGEIPQLEARQYTRLGKVQVMNTAQIGSEQGSGDDLHSWDTYYWERGRGEGVKAAFMQLASSPTVWIAVGHEAQLVADHLQVQPQRIEEEGWAVIKLPGMNTSRQEMLEQLIDGKIETWLEGDPDLVRVAMEIDPTPFVLPAPPHAGTNGATWLAVYHRFQKERQGEARYSVPMISTGKSGAVKLVIGGYAHYIAERLMGAKPEWVQMPGGSWTWVLKLHVPVPRPGWYQDLLEEVPEGIEFVGIHDPQLKQFADRLTTAEPGRKDPKAKSAGLFPAAFGKTFVITEAKIKVQRQNSYLHSSSQTTRTYGVWLDAMGKSGNQANLYSVRQPVRIGEEVELSTGGAVKARIPLAEWQALADQLPVEVSATSITTIRHTPELVQMCRDVIAFRRDAPTEADWLAEEATAAAASSETAPVDSVKASTYDDWELADDLMLEVAPQLGLDLESAQAALLDMSNVSEDLEAFCLMLKMFAERYQFAVAEAERIDQSAAHGPSPAAKLDAHFRAAGYTVTESGRGGQANGIDRYLERDTVRVSAAYLVDHKADSTGNVFIPLTPGTGEIHAQAGVLVLLTPPSQQIYLLKREDVAELLARRGAFLRIIDKGSTHGVLVPLEQLSRIGRAQELVS